MSSLKLNRPVAVCSSCRMASREIFLVNHAHSCGEGQRGIWRIALSASNWADCRLCQTIGVFAGKKCDVCDGNGWIFIKLP